MRILLRSALVVWVVLLAVPTVLGQDTDEARSSRLQQAAFEAFSRGDFAAAEGPLREAIVLDPSDVISLYNLACARSMQGDQDEAAALLREAVAQGFDRLEHMKRDEHLAGVRDHPGFMELLREWDRLIEGQIDARVEREKTRFGRGYSELRDAGLRLVYLSAFDETSFREARDEVRLVADWAQRAFLPGILDAHEPPDPWVVVILPETDGFNAWARRTLGEAANNDFHGIGGRYEHDAKRLIARDIGATLRHEYLHVLHWRDCARRGQMHAIWVQEGLCSLIEDYDVVMGEVVPVGSWRTNIVKRLERGGRLPSIREVAQTPHERFTGTRPLAHYALARGVFLYLHDRGTLGEWYEEYCRTFREDPTGVTAIERVLGAPIGEVDRDYRAWVRALPEVPEEITQGMASLGVEIEWGDGDGPKVASFTRGKRGVESLRRGDVIKAIDGRATRDFKELVRVLGTYSTGQEVLISVRRGTEHLEVPVTLSVRR